MMDMDAGSKIASCYAGNSNLWAFAGPGKAVKEFYYGNRFPRVVVTERTEEEDASHWYMCEEHLRTNKSLTVKFPFALFISLNSRRHFSMVPWDEPVALRSSTA